MNEIFCLRIFGARSRQDVIGAGLSTMTELTRKWFSIWVRGTVNDQSSLTISLTLLSLSGFSQESVTICSPLDKSCYGLCYDRQRHHIKNRHSLQPDEVAAEPPLSPTFMIEFHDITKQFHWSFPIRSISKRRVISQLTLQKTKRHVRPPSDKV